MKRVILSALVALVCFGATAQGFKVGYTNVEYILEYHPKIKEIQSQIETETSVYRKEIETKTQEFQTKLQQYQSSQAMMSDIAKAEKEKELQFLQNSIQDMQQNAQLKLMQKQQTLLDPILQEVEKVIDEVASAEGYDYVFNGSTSNGTSIVLYAKNKGDNLTAKIFEKLGIPITDQIKAELAE